MASPPGPGSSHRLLSSSSSKGPLSPFPGAARFPSHAAGPLLRHQHLPGGESDGGASADEFDEDEDDMDEEYDDEEEESELVGGAARSSQQRCASSEGIGRAVMNGDNGARQLQKGKQWQLHNGEPGQYGHTSSGGDEELGSIPREMSVEDGYGIIGRREGGPASSYWDLLRAHLSDPLTKLAANVVSQLLRTPFDQTWLFALQFRHLDARRSQQKH